MLKAMLTMVWATKKDETSVSVMRKEARKDSEEKRGERELDVVKRADGRPAGS